MEEKKQQIVDTAGRLLTGFSRKEKASITDISLLSGDGSQRGFYRLRIGSASTMVAVLPAADNPLGMAEAAASWNIGCHLRRAGIPVPEPLAYDQGTGLILFEDLGDLRFDDLLGQDDCLREDCRFNLYREAIQELVRMQVKGREGFDTSWCWQTARYDRELMLERESRYFLQALCHDFFNLRPDLDSLNREFVRLADVASQAPADYFLHRDFQSRNIMVTDAGDIRIIDFQGGRLGPLAYDLASLLIDPYVSISSEFRETMLDEYISELVKNVKYDPLAFREEYLYLAMQRNLQILGAFAFLGKQRRKSFFLQFIHPALLSVQDLLGKMNRRNFPVLAGLINRCLEEIERVGAV